MKKFILGSILIFVFLPQLSFGANQNLAVITDPALVAFNQQEDAKSAVFFEQQVADRIAFMKANSDIVAKEEHRFKDWMAKRDADRRQAQLTGAARTVSDIPPARQDPTMAAFEAKQLADKNTFLAQLAQERQAFLSAQSGAGSPG